PVGLGYTGDGGFENVGEELDRKKRAQMLDESLAIVDGLWSGEPFAFEGEHYHVKEMTFLPKPVQSPRVPVWVVGAWPRKKSMRRTLRWDGILPVVMRGDERPAEPSPEEAGRRIAEEGAFAGDITPADIAEISEYVRREREAAPPFEVVIEGWSSGSNREKAAAKIGEYEAAGATWWIEAVWSYLYLPPHDVERMRRRIRRGPPRAS
ncbi:MAG: LLM class flavin-dependent oxidoreductase, partial [Dehalococcoidia bacterium]|nr:LLM class flavin-dependent oxidoreductase [Dehalococcoidia bacterium]